MELNMYWSDISFTFFLNFDTNFIVCLKIEKNSFFLGVLDYQPRYAWSDGNSSQEYQNMV